MQVTNLLNAVEFVFVPLVNPDGYEVYYILAGVTIVLERTFNFSCSTLGMVTVCGERIAG